MTDDLRAEDERTANRVELNDHPLGLQIDRPVDEPQFDADDHLRREWAFNHACPAGIAAIYGDDGELHCNRCMIDFKRLPMDELYRRVTEIRLQRASIVPSASSPATVERSNGAKVSGAWDGIAFTATVRCHECGAMHITDYDALAPHNLNGAVDYIAGRINRFGWTYDFDRNRPIDEQARWHCVRHPVAITEELGRSSHKERV